MWGIVKNDLVKEVIKSPKDITIDGVTYPKTVFTKWSLSDLVDIGIYPARRIAYDKSTHTATGFDMNFDGNEVVVTPILQEIGADVLAERLRLVELQTTETELQKTDAGMARSGEDLYAMFKNFLVHFNANNPDAQFIDDLPQPSQDKITERETLRSKLRTLTLSNE